MPDAPSLPQTSRIHRPLDITSIQLDLKLWKLHNFPASDDRDQLLGIVEELGELAHAILKLRQGIRGTPAEHEAAAKDAVGDLFIFLTNFCSARDWVLEDIIHDTVATVLRRDWQANKQSGQVDTMLLCPICHYPIPPDKCMRVGGEPVHVTCASTYARTRTKQPSSEGDKKG